jgi:hypothetical protein
MILALHEVVLRDIVSYTGIAESNLSYLKHLVRCNGQSYLLDIF